MVNACVCARAIHSCAAARGCKTELNNDQTDIWLSTWIGERNNLGHMRNKACWKKVRIPEPEQPCPKGLVTQVFQSAPHDLMLLVPREGQSLELLRGDSAVLKLTVTESFTCVLWIPQAGRTANAPQIWSWFTFLFLWGLLRGDVGPKSHESHCNNLKFR